MEMLKKTIGFSILTTVIVLFAILASCGSMDRAEYTENWTTVCGRFSPSTGKIICDKSGEPKADGFTFETLSDGGIKVSADSPSDTLGAYASAILQSKNKTPLDGLTVEIIPQKANFRRDFDSCSEVISLLWSADALEDIKDLQYSEHFATNGLRDMAKPTKGLCVTLNNTYTVYDDTMCLSNVMITKIDGDFRDAGDDRLGYRWTFTARNNLSQSPNSDGTGICRAFEKIDISDGLKISVHAEKEHGFIVAINDVEYYSADNIAYFPNNVDDYMAVDSMTMQMQDIDLKSLADTQGYVNFGFCGTLDKTLDYSFIVESVNGVPASIWAGK